MQRTLLTFSKALLCIILPGYLLDQATKWAVLQNITPYDSIPVIPGFFNLVHVYNKGAAFGMGSDYPWIFLTLSIVVFTILLILFFLKKFQDNSAIVGVSCFMSGILGNTTDRFLHRHVIDFLDFYIGTYHWPAFNVADSLICIAAAILIFRPEKK